ncbi:MAG: DUF3419 family protein [Deltaproteobacteria bacterium]|nr:DUF3419 family protein [Deltaproteobacteria bacterium]
MRSDIIKADFFKRIGYSTVWEDERVISEGLAPRDGDRVLSITSGGCFSLQFLALGAGEVVSLDFNRNQNALLELKVAAAKKLPHTDLWEFLGLAPSRSRLTTFERLREALSPWARDYWDRNLKLIERGVGVAGKQDQYFHWLGRFLTLLQGRRRVRAFLSCPDAEAQRRFFDDEWTSFAWRRFSDVAFSRFVLDRAFHKDHFAYSRETDPAVAIRRAAEHVLRDVPVWDNFYLYYLFKGTYPTNELCPAWLRASTYATLRQRLHRLTIETGELEQFIFSQPDASIDCFNFSNIFDWVSVENFAKLLREVVRVARPGARLCYWTNIVNTKREIDPKQIPEIREDRTLAEKIFAANRTPGYSSVVVARVEK